MYPANEDLVTKVFFVELSIYKKYSINDPIEIIHLKIMTRDPRYAIIKGQDEFPINFCRLAIVLLSNFFLFCFLPWKTSPLWAYPVGTILGLVWAIYQSKTYWKNPNGKIQKDKSSDLAQEALRMSEKSPLPLNTRGSKKVEASQQIEGVPSSEIVAHRHHPLTSRISGKHMEQLEGVPSSRVAAYHSRSVTAPASLYSSPFTPTNEQLSNKSISNESKTNQFSHTSGPTNSPHDPARKLNFFSIASTSPDKSVSEKYMCNTSMHGTTQKISHDACVVSEEISPLIRKDNF